MVRYVSISVPADSIVALLCLCVETSVNPPLSFLYYICVYFKAISVFVQR